MTKTRNNQSSYKNVKKTKKNMKKSKKNVKKGGNNIPLYSLNDYKDTMNVHFPSRNCEIQKGGKKNQTCKMKKSNKSNKKYVKGGNVNMFSAVNNQMSNPVHNFFDANQSSKIIGANGSNVNSAAYIQPVSQ